MEILAKNKGVILTGAVLLLLMFGYNFFVQNETLVSDESSGAIGADLLQMSAQLSQAELNQGVFSDPKYLHLIDFSTVIPTQPRGRTNPFAILGQ